MDIQQIVRELKPLVMGWMYADLGDGWRIIPYGAAYGSATTITFAGVDCTVLFPVGAPVRWRQREGWLYGYVVSVAFSTDTTLTVVGNSVVNAPIGAVWVSHGINPTGFPGWFAYSPTPTGFSSVPATADYRFAIVGRVVTLVVAKKVDGTSNATTLTVSLPVTAATVGTAGTWTGTNGHAVDNGIGLTVASRWNINSGGTTIDFYTNMSLGEWTNAGGKRVRCVAQYEI